MRALVTGANGFTGSYLVKNLLSKGIEVTGLVRKNCDLNLLKDVNVNLVIKDLVKDENFDDIMSGIDIVFHVAAAYRNENVPQKYFFDVNVEGTRKLLEASSRVGVKRFVHCSTVGVQGEIANPPAKEDAPFNPGDYYQKSKVEGELLALEHFKKHNLSGVVVRPVGIYGPGDTRFLKLFKFIYNNKFRMIGSGKVLYHLTYVEDLAEGIYLAGIKSEIRDEVFTIGGEKYVPLSELVGIIGKIFGKELNKFSIPVWPVWTAGLIFEIICKPFGITPPIYRRRVDFFMKDRAFDISKAKKMLGYQPKISLADGLKKTADWYLENGWLK